MTGRLSQALILPSSASPLLSRALLRPLLEDDVRVRPHPDRPRVVVGEGDPRLAAKAGVPLHLKTKIFQNKV